MNSEFIQLAVVRVHKLRTQRFAGEQVFSVLCLHCYGIPSYIWPHLPGSSYCLKYFLDMNCSVCICSWLGKGLIKETPDTVWEAIVNPYTRCIHDDMLKEVTVISDLGNGMKLCESYVQSGNLRLSIRFVIIRMAFWEIRKTLNVKTHFDF